MPKRRAKKAVKQSVSSPERNENGVEAEESQFAEQPSVLTDQDVEHQSAAIRAIRDVEIERLLTELRLLRSYFNKEQLQTPVLQFFKESLPNLLVANDQNREIEVQWKDKDGKLSKNPADGLDVHTSFLHRLSIAYPHCSAAIPSLAQLEFSGKAVNSSLLGADSLQIQDFVADEPSAPSMFNMTDVLQTPGVNNQRLSIGMTPKTLRLPKPGEILLSVHGSPLGVYKEDNMEAIQESEERLSS